MPSRKPPPSALGSADETEAQFYEALQQGDIERLMAAWADDEEIVCVHPGGPRVVGIAAIRAAFESIFAHGAVDAHPERVRRLQSHGSAVHSVLERVNLMTPEGPRSAWVIATNVYQKTPQGWRLVAHHASPGLQDQPAEAAQASSVLH
jgi:ketosteroid isomerase-like protein